MTRTIPAYGRVIQHEGGHVCVLGNSLENGLLWCASWPDGQRIDVEPESLLSASELSVTVDQVIERVEAWARNGNADAAWWLGWLHAGVNLPKSIWYYLAAIRIDPRAHGWALGRIKGDALTGYLCRGVVHPDITFMKTIPEFFGKEIGGDWVTAIECAQQALHEPFRKDQIVAAVEEIIKGAGVTQAALDAGITVQCLKSAPEYLAYRNNQSEQIQVAKKNPRTRAGIECPCGHPLREEKRGG